MRQFGAQPLYAPSADRIYHDSDRTIRTLMESMVSEYRAMQPGYLEMIRCHLIQTLVCMLRSGAETQRAADRHPAVAAMAEYIYDHYTQPLSLSALSRLLGYTPQYLSRLFHQQMGQSLSAYLQRLRVEASCQLLLSTRQSVSLIAQAVGYTDLKHFSAVFARHMGMTPRAFRSRMTGGRAAEEQKKSADVEE